MEIIKKNSPDKIVALMGNPNVGKSTVFNALTGLKQHTGNWPGKTVEIARGTHSFEGSDYILIDLPGMYSLSARSKEEEVARDFLLNGSPDAVVVICDATCLERNIILALQAMEITPNVVVCVNLMDEARKKGIDIDLIKLEEKLGVPVTGTSARASVGLSELMKRVHESIETPPKPRKVLYSKPIEDAVRLLEPLVGSRYLALRLLERNDDKTPDSNEVSEAFGNAINNAKALIRETGITCLRDSISACVVLMAEEVCLEAASCSQCKYAHERDRNLDRILTNRWIGIPIMLALLSIVFYITLTGSNYPSALIAKGLFYIQDRLIALFISLNAPYWLYGSLVLGVYRVLAWVVSVMLPPMAIFFPLFTLLEDFGYLPRIAFNLDHSFKSCKACGKQALTMLMGFGCNAVGVTGCRIIDSPRERLIAILTNNLVPCNGRFPVLIALIAMFFAGTGALSGLISTAMLTLVIVLGICATLFVSRLLSVTLLKGEPSSFTLELPPYRTPQFGKVIVRSLLDRTLFVLGRAVSVAAPCGLLIWSLANISVGETSLLAHCADFLDPFARALGMDGVILFAFILGFPANEIVIPIIVMSYLSTGVIQDMSSFTELKVLLTANGWTWATAVSTLLFCLMHWPCSTTCLTIRKETGGVKWTALSIIVPTALGVAVCFVFTSVVRILGLV